jgi:regulator of replication initiation timing
MSQKFKVCAQNDGFNYFCRAGRHWQCGVWVEVEVLDQEGDVFLQSKDSDAPKKPNPVVMGKAAWRLITDEKLSKKISWRPAGTPSAEEALPLALELQAVNAGLAKELDGAKEAHGELVAKLAELEAKVSELLTENGNLSAELTRVNAELESLTAPAAKTDEPKAKSKAVK